MVRDASLIAFGRVALIAMVTALLAVCFTRFLYIVHGTSMEPTFYRGDTFVGIKCLAEVHCIVSRGNIGVFRMPEEQGQPLLVKRIVAVSGDTVQYLDGQLLVNGGSVTRPGQKAAMHELSAPRWHFRYLVGNRDHYLPDGRNWGPVLLPYSTVFLLGDNPGESRDSRSFGPVATSQQIARPFVVLPLGALLSCIRHGAQLRHGCRNR